MRWIPPEGFLIKRGADIEICSTGECTLNLFTNETGGFFTEFESNCEEETAALGKRIAAFLAGGSVIALRGTLGSGKTCLARGIACGLGIGENLTSPTYTIVSEYQGKEPGSPALYHIDAYRLNNEEDFDQLGGSEIINGDGISIIEWSERIQKSLPYNTITITLEITGPSSRLIKIKVPEAG